MREENEDEIDTWTHIFKIADKKTAYNEGHLYLIFVYFYRLRTSNSNYEDRQAPEVNLIKEIQFLNLKFVNGP